MTEPASPGAILWQNWERRTRIDQLPPDCRPADREAGYSAQKDIVRCSGQNVVGWKIAATSAAGQKHIGVDGPLAGPLLANRVLSDGAAVPLDGNIMMVAEAEFAFRFGAALPKRANPYTQAEVLGAVRSLHPAIEVPDSALQRLRQRRCAAADRRCRVCRLVRARRAGDRRVARPRSRRPRRGGVPERRTGGDRQRRQRARRSPRRPRLARERASHVR